METLRDILFVGSAYLIIAFSVAMLIVFLFRVKVLGRFWMALVIAVAGSVLGGVLNELLFDVIEVLANLNGGKFNIFPPLIVSIAAVLTYSGFGRKGDR